MDESPAPEDTVQASTNANEEPQKVGEIHDSQETPKMSTIDDPLTALKKIERLAKVAVSPDGLTEDRTQLMKATSLLRKHFKLSLRQSHTHTIAHNIQKTQKLTALLDARSSRRCG